MLLASSVFAAGNNTIQSFNKAKKALEQSVYFDHRETIYCAATFDETKNITLPAGFTTPKHQKRALPCGKSVHAREKLVFTVGKNTHKKLGTKNLILRAVFSSKGLALVLKTHFSNWSCYLLSSGGAGCPLIPRDYS